MRFHSLVVVLRFIAATDNRQLQSSNAEKRDAMTVITTKAFCILIAMMILSTASSFRPLYQLYPAKTSLSRERRMVAAARDEGENASPSMDGNGRKNETTDSESVEDPLLESAIDSFLRGEYDRPFEEDAPAPYPKLSPGATIETALRSLRNVDEPEPSHGAAVLQRFCAPLSRAERWGGEGTDPWKEVLRGALTPAMLSRRIRASQFSGLLDWEKLDVTEGMSLKKDEVIGPTLAYVNAALYFGKGVEPSIIQFTLRRVAGVWLIDKARVSKMELFVDDSDDL